MAGVHVHPDPLDNPETHGFLRHIAANPGDPLPRMVFADWLQDEGYDNAATGQRWAAENNKYPIPDTRTPEGRHTFATHPAFEAARRHGLNGVGWYAHYPYLEDDGAGDPTVVTETMQHRTPGPVHENIVRAYGKIADDRFANRQAAARRGELLTDDVTPSTKFPASHESEAVLLDALHNTTWDRDGEPVGRVR